ncbi:hypothetical protein QAD02_003059 [Eretmocerus hayati]|uniref:Uncharacterized protein n=1 Tax=Eretmocerus hayati TaxID=131215 RepID=A0ACC2NKL9_9HYME|nr:hypothetical protein QAD02_003059 [Eretmocerus hayati]
MIKLSPELYDNPKVVLLDGAIPTLKFNNESRPTGRKKRKASTDLTPDGNVIISKISHVQQLSDKETGAQLASKWTFENEPTVSISNQQAFYTSLVQNECRSSALCHSNSNLMDHDYSVPPNSLADGVSHHVPPSIGSNHLTKQSVGDFNSIRMYQQTLSITSDTTNSGGLLYGSCTKSAVNGVDELKHSDVTRQAENVVSEACEFDCSMNSRDEINANDSYCSNFNSFESNSCSECHEGDELYITDCSSDIVPPPAEEEVVFASQNINQ